MLLALLSLPFRADALKALEPGDEISPVSVLDEASGARRVSGLLGPRGALVVFWASWSPRSRDILTYARELDRTYRDQGLRVVPVNVEHEGLTAEQIAELSAVYARWDLPWPSYYDVRLDAFAALGIITVPTTVYLGADSRLSGSYPGFPAEGREELRDLVERGLGIWSPPVAPRRAVPLRYVPKNGAGQRLQMARLLAGRGQWRKAAEEARRAAERDPDYALAQAAAAFLSETVGGSAEEGVARLGGRAGEEPNFREALGVALLALGRPGEALRTLEPLLALEEPHPRGLVALAYVRSLSGGAEAGRAVLDRLRAWPVGGVALEVDTSEWVDAGRPLEDQWSDPRALALRLLGL